MIEVDIVLKSKKWQQETLIEKQIKKICQNLFPLTPIAFLLKRKTIAELSISLVNDQSIKKINNQFRQKNKATNVLSFPSLDENLIKKIGVKKVINRKKYFFLGDVILAYETIKKEAEIEKKKFLDHLTHLILHSILHLIGLDHENEKEAEIMEKLEVKILKKLKIKNPYELSK
jgi:probable rRNA maturation factor